MKEGVDDMIKFLANEPSVGLFFVQQHAQTSMPYLLNLKVCVFSSISSNPSLEVFGVFRRSGNLNELSIEISCFMIPNSYCVR